MITVVVTTCGRDYLRSTWPSFFEAAGAMPITNVIVHDDSGSDVDETKHWFEHHTPAALLDGLDLRVIGVGLRRVGQPTAIARLWAAVASIDAGPYVFHLEDDFEFVDPIPWRGMIDLLDDHQELQQVALKRQAWYPLEVAAGGYVEADPDRYRERCDEHGRRWVEHRETFTLNPCLYRRDLTTLRYPQGPDHEVAFSRQLRRMSPRFRFGIWGGKFAPPMVTHIGTIKGGSSS